MYLFFCSLSASIHEILEVAFLYSSHHGGGMKRSIILFAEHRLQLVHKLRHRVQYPVVQMRRIFQWDGADSLFPYDKKRNGRNGNASPATTAKGIADCTWVIAIVLKFTPPRCEAEPHFGDRQNHAAVRCLHWIPNDRIDIDHLLDIFHRRSH